MTRSSLSPSLNHTATPAGSEWLKLTRAKFCHQNLWSLCLLLCLSVAVDHSVNLSRMMTVAAAALQTRWFPGCILRRRTHQGAMETVSDLQRDLRSDRWPGPVITTRFNNARLILGQSRRWWLNVPPFPPNRFSSCLNRRIRDLFPGLGGLKETNMFLLHPLAKLVLWGVSVTER